LRCVAAITHRWELFRKMIGPLPQNEKRNRSWNGSVIRVSYILMRDEIDLERRVDI